ncbi:MAG TPA: pseudaminic acid synthase [Spirochaetes bacterium]|nr:pseudaminic acid synthase [Spirochaetota bacterium]
MSQSIQIEKYSIGQNHPPFIIAEMSGNHNQSLEQALKIVEAAAETGAHALKLQTYTADTMTIDGSHESFYINDPNSLWKGQSLYNLYQKAYTPWEWHEAIFKRCYALGIIPFSTPFDDSAVDFLENLNVSAYKIASFENNHLPLIRKVAQTGKPMIISTGMASLSELEEAVDTARSEGCQDIILLKCTSTYPASPENSHLLTIPHLRELFDVEVGLSDHTMGIGVSVASVALGSTVIEKHFTLSRAEGGVDSAFSMEPHEMKQLVQESLKAWQAMGKVHYGSSPAEEKSRVFRRSIYAVEDIKKEETLTYKNIRIIRPGKGLAPKYYDTLLGKKTSIDLKKGTPISWNCVG